MNDHQDSEHFTYERTWSRKMLDKAERKQNKHITAMQHATDKRMYHMRN